MTTLTLPDEVVTAAHLQFVAVPGLDGVFALITLDNGHDHHRPTTLGPSGLRNIAAALAEATSRDDVRGIGFTGKPYFFGAGADLNGVATLTDEADAEAILRLGHEVFAEIRAAEVPTFAFINGLALGGALELALHADYRTAASSAAGIGLPEVFLGLAPGWGGSWLLPHLVGIEAALKIIVENPLAQNRLLKPAQAAKIGLVDEVFDSADFLAQSLAWAVKVINGDELVTRKDVDTGETWDFAVMIAGKLIDERLHGATPAPLAALELLRRARTSDYATGMTAEEELVAPLLRSTELRNSLYAFDLIQRKAKKMNPVPKDTPTRPIGKVGIIGAGLMASQLALLFARRLGAEVVMTDIDADRLATAKAYLARETVKLLEKGRISELQAARIAANTHTTTNKAEFADVDFVIEAVFEELGVKQQVLAEIEPLVPTDCIIATNTSSLSVTAMADGLAHPERFVGFHFFNPVAVMPLIEVVRTDHTNDTTVASAFALARGLKKTPVLVKDARAFVVNRILVRALSEVLAAIDVGADVTVANSSMDSLGLPMRPLELIELVGPAVALHVQKTLHEEYPDRFAISPYLSAAVAAGKKSLLVRERGQLVADPELPVPTPDPALDADAVFARVKSALAQEVDLMLREGVVSSPAELDICMILGAGWPLHLGGITPYLAENNAENNA